MSGDSGAKGKIKGVGVGTTIEAAMDGVQVERPVLWIVQLDPGIIDRSVCSRLCTVPSGTWESEYLVDK